MESQYIVAFKQSILNLINEESDTEEYMIYWTNEFNPQTPDFKLKLIQYLIQNIEGLDFILESSDLTTFIYQECEISMTCEFNYFILKLLCRPNDTPIVNSDIPNVWWFED